MQMVKTMEQKSITRIGEMKAQSGRENDLRAFYETVIMPALDEAPGMQSYHLLQNQVDPARFIFIEIWDSIEAHQGSVKNINPEDIQNVMSLLAEKPWGEYYSA
jgi:quinol monooxygenase YgiN